MEPNLTSSPTCIYIGSRKYTSYFPLEQELHFKKNKNYLFSLPHLTGLSVVGKESENFLQGQVSCNVKEVRTDTMRKGALCNLKGRILALVDILFWKNFEVILPTDLLESTKNALIKPAMLSRIKLEQTSYKIYGFYLNNVEDLFPEGFSAKLSLFKEPRSVYQADDFYCYYLGEGFYVLLIDNSLPPHALEALEKPFKNANQFRGSSSWHYLLLQQKQFEIYPETRGVFLPHRVDLHISGYLSFDKGCYKGQEVIARTHYKAVLKHELKLFYLIGLKEPLIVGEKLLSKAELTIGELVDYSPIGEGNYLILASIIFDHDTEIRFSNHQHQVTLKKVDPLN